MKDQAEKLDQKKNEFQDPAEKLDQKENEVQDQAEKLNQKEIEFQDQAEKLDQEEKECKKERNVKICSIFCTGLLSKSSALPMLQKLLRITNGNCVCFQKVTFYFPSPQNV